MKDTPGANPLDRLAALRAEHKPILEAISADVGMAPTTRSLLVEHLREEEDARLAEALARGGKSGGAAPPSSSPSWRGRLTVGSLRRDGDGLPGSACHGATTRSVGSLRPR
jgi:hypothetical protein